jgi:hypothetical protein
MDAGADAQAATLVVDVEVAGDPADATIRVHDASGALVIEGHAREELRMRPGVYAVRVSCPTARAEHALEAVRLVARTTARRIVRFE